MATAIIPCAATLLIEKIDFYRYLAYMHGQIEELVTNYGKIDILWFDYAYDELRGEAWRATDLIRMVRRHQPDVIIDNRLETSGEGFGSLVTEQPAYYSGDFVSPEQILPRRASAMCAASAYRGSCVRR